MTPDLITGLFEVGGALFVLLSVRRVLQDRSVAGISWPMVGFFSAWGSWNLYFYPAVGCWFSFAGGVLILLANAAYLALLLTFDRRKG